MVARARASEPRGRRRLVETFLSLLSAEFASRLGTIVAVLVVVRALAPPVFGSFSYALAVGTLAAAAAELGLSSLLIRETSSDRHGASALLGSALVLQGVAGVLVVGGGTALAAAGGLGTTATTAAIAVALVGGAIGVAARPFEATLTGYGRARLVTVGRAARAVALIGATLVALDVAPTPVGFLAAVAFAELAGLATSAVLCRARAVAPRRPASWTSQRALLRAALPFALFASFGLLYTRLDVVMLGLLDSSTAVGLYTIAARALEIVVLVPIYLGGAFLATVAHDRATSARAERVLRYSLAIGVICSFVLAAAAGPLVRVVAGHGYAASAPLLVRLSPIVLLTASYAVLSNLQIAVGRTAVLVRLTAAGVAAKIALNLILIPAYGARGAAAAAVIAELGVVAAQWWAARSLLDLRPVARWSLRLGACTAAMVAAALIAERLAPALTLPAGLLALAIAGLLAGWTPARAWRARPVDAGATFGGDGHGPAPDTPPGARERRDPLEGERA